MNIIPQPACLQYTNGIFHCKGLPSISGDTMFQNEIHIFKQQIYENFKEKIQDSTHYKIVCLENSTIEGKESYKININPETIEIYASSKAGMYHGLQTIRQVFLSHYIEGKLSIKCAEIEDYPRFSWRGFMLDTSRHFYSIKFIKKMLDVISLHHMNKFHWHLTDDQGWRLPVKEYPLLTTIGSMKKDNRFPWKGAEGGFYSEDEIRDIVDYALQRHIEIIPEVDLPGHANASLASYPELGCTGGPYKVEDRFGIFDEVLCAGNDGIFDFCEAVFDTLIRLFPSKYIHIGGDEVKTSFWKECPKCQNRMKDNGLENVEQLQSWITVKLAKMLKEKGKIPIGWDEVLDGTEKLGLPEDLVVMSWRGQEGGIAATARNHQVIMAPLTDGCYLDYKHYGSVEEPGNLSIITVYQSYMMDPITQNMTEKQSQYVLGGQCNLWSELIYASKIAEYMIFPRLCAISESLWTQKNQKDFNAFAQKLPIHQKRLDKLDFIQYRGILQ